MFLPFFRHNKTPKVFCLTFGVHVIEMLFCMPAIKRPVFLDGVFKNAALAIKRPVFLAGSRGYLLYLYDLTENIN